MQVPLVEFLPLMHEDRRLLVGVGVLMSYEHSGWVHIDCVNGCSCQRREVNTHHPIRRAPPRSLLSNVRALGGVTCIGMKHD